MFRLNLTRRIALAASLGLLTGAIASLFLIWEMRATASAYDQLLREQHLDLARVTQASYQAQEHEWKTLLARGANYEDFTRHRDLFKQAGQAVRTNAEAMLRQVADSDALGRIRAFVAAHEAMGRPYDAAIAAFEASKGQDISGAEALVNGRNREASEAIDGAIARLQAVTTLATAAQQSRVTATIRVALAGVAATFTANAVLAFLLIRRTRRDMAGLATQLRKSADGTAAAAGHVSTSAHSLSQGATEQAASLQQTSASMEEMASMTRQNAENSQAAASLMTEVDTRVNGSNQALRDMVASMSSIRDSSQQVAKIIKTIDEIAFQTNILALNAAVEAARAGDAGMGFAVVADEVRSLAQRSAQAARDTTALIEESIAKAQGGTKHVEHVAAAISRITEGVSKVKGLVEEVSLASRQQSQGIDQVSQAIAQMEKVTQTTAATAEESAAASEELTAQADGAMTAVRKLEALVGGAAAGPASPAPARVAAAANTGRLLRMGGAARAANTPTAEDLLPMDDTGTYGRR